MKRNAQVYLALVLSFILGIHGENIALWKAGQPDPVKVFPYRAAMLPREAREALEQGIGIDSLEELEALAENYLS